MLRLRVDDELLDRIGYRPAPLDWGNAIIQYWAVNLAADGGTLFPDEVVEPVHIEGATTQVLVNVYERNREARMACLDHFGVTCQACSIDFEKTYGARGAGFIHVHHLRKISDIGAEYEVDPIRDLIPVCPNCHSMIHRKAEMLTVAELRQILTGQKESS
jgi:predicted HNH restriction endonuclease